MWDNPTLLQQAKSIEKNIEKKTNIDVINCKKFLDRPTDHK